MRTVDLNYELPGSLIAQHPCANRVDSRLLVVHRAERTWSDRRFAKLTEIIKPEDLLVLNNTRVVPAKFSLRRNSGGRIEGLWLDTQSDGLWRVLLRDASRLKVGEKLCFERTPDKHQVTVIDRTGRGTFLLGVSAYNDAETALQQVGLMPLPHYIKRDANDSSQEREDRERYQTVYAKQSGAVAAPTAGLHFDEEMLRRLQSGGVQIAEVTLHVGLGTFQPIEVEDLKDHLMHTEQYEVTEQSWNLIRQAKEARRRIVAVGTTTARVLETVARTGLTAAETDLFIYPPYTFQMVGALITNFHLPCSTLLAMIYAFGGTELMRQVYSHAIAKQYRFYSYGDAVLIE